MSMWHTRKLTLSIQGALALSCACRLAAQPAQTNEQRLPSAQVQPLATWSHPFTQIGAVRELTDGSVLVLDPRDRALFALPSTDGAARQIGRQGGGPGEYRYPVFLAALNGDTTLVIDGQRREWMLLDRTSFVVVSPQLRAHAKRVGTDLKSVDKQGNALTIVAKPRARETLPAGNDPSLHDSLTVVVHYVSGRRDSVATLFSEASGRSMVRVPGEREPFSLPSLLNASDQAVMFGDGSVAVARVSPYRVERRVPDGRVVRGQASSEVPVALTRTMQSVLVRNFKQRPDGTAFFRVQDFPHWPKTLPAFRSGALLAAVNGQLYIRRTLLSRDSSQLVDVFDSRGARIRTFSLPPRTRLVGSGSRGLYVARLNANDEELLMRISY